MLHKSVGNQGGKNGVNTAKTRMGVLLSVFVAGTVASGCATHPEIKEAPKVTIESELSRSASGIQRLLNELVLLERSRSGGEPYRAAVDALPKDDPLQKRDSLVWIGEARTVVSRIALMAGLEFVVEGKSPVSLVVAIDMRDQPLVSMLEVVGAQIGQVATIAYDPSEASLTLRYRD